MNLDTRSGWISHVLGTMRATTTHVASLTYWTQINCATTNCTPSTGTWTAQRTSMAGLPHHRWEPRSLNSSVWDALFFIFFLPFYCGVKISVQDIQCIKLYNNMFHLYLAIYLQHFPIYSAFTLYNAVISHTLFIYPVYFWISPALPHLLDFFLSLYQTQSLTPSAHDTSFTSLNEINFMAQTNQMAF